MPNLLRGPGRSELRPPAHRRIVSITDGGAETIVYTTAAPHGLAGSETIRVEGTPLTAYNRAIELGVEGSVLSATTFSCGISFVAVVTGGTWRFA